METRFLIVDGNSMACRAAYAKPDLATSKGIPTGGTHLFFIMLNNILLKVRPTHVLIAFDVSRNTFRTQLASDYKGNRGTSTGQNETLKQQFRQIQTILKLAGIKQLGIEGFEADDIIGTYTALSKADKNFILSGDRDVFQLIDDKTQVFFPKIGISNMEMMTSDKFKNEFDISVEQYIDYKTLRGDSGDNIEGCPGCGPKKAAGLLKQYNDLGGIIEHASEVKGKFGESLREWLPNCELTKQLVTIRKDVPVPYDFDECLFKPDWKNTLEVLTSLELNTLISKVNGGTFYDKN